MEKTNERGITLIVLAITVIVMLILAAVVIHLTIGEDGLIRRAEDASVRYTQAQNNEIAMLNNINKEYDKILNNVGGEDTSGKPSIQEVRTSTTSNSIRIEVIATKATSYRYYYKKASEYNYTVLREQSENTYTIEGITEKGTYKVKVEAINEKGMVEKEVEVVIGEIPSASGEITFSNLVWQNKKASMSLSTTSGYKIQYQINNNIEGGWVTGTQVSQLSLNDVVYARLWDESQAGEYTYITVTEITPPTVDVQIGQVSTSSIQVTASARDNESGMADNPEYEYYIKRSSEPNYPVVPSYRGGNTYTYIGLNNNTSYDIKVVTHDIAGNEGSNVSTGNRTVEITGEGGGISFGAVEWQSNQTARIRIETTTSYTVQYQINGTSDGNWQTGTIIDNLRLNDRVYARLWDGYSGGASISTIISDTVIPNAANIEFSKQSANVEESITATIIQSDSQSGVNIGACRWVYNTIATEIGTNASSYTGGGFSNTNQTINLSASTAGTYYLHVLTTDNAGKVRESIAGPVTVKRLVTQIVLSQDNIKLEPGEIAQITAEVIPNNATDTGIIWTSSNENVATVVGGTITAVGTGTVTITATATDGSGASASCIVTVEGLVDAVVTLASDEVFPTWTSASVFKRSKTPYDANNPDNLSGQYKKLTKTTGSYIVETWVDANGTQWWYCKAKTVQLPVAAGKIFYNFVTTNTIQEIYLNDFDTSRVSQFLYGEGSYPTKTYGLTHYSTYYPSDGSGSNKYWSNLKTIHIEECDFTSLTTLSFMGSGITNMDFSVVKDAGSTMTKLTSLARMFQSCAELRQVDFGNINVQSVTNMSYMFGYCTKLQTVNMSNFNTISCSNFGSMFYNCSSLQNVTVGTRFVNTAVTTASGFSKIFYNTPSSFNKDCLGWTNGTWDANGTFTKN